MTFHYKCCVECSENVVAENVAFFLADERDFVYIERLIIDKQNNRRQKIDRLMDRQK